jgi:hypothetical protein
MPDISLRKIYYGDSIRKVQMFATSSMHMGIERRKDEEKRHLGHPGSDGRKILKLILRK